MRAKIQQTAFANAHVGLAGLTRDGAPARLIGEGLLRKVDVEKRRIAQVLIGGAGASAAHRLQQAHAFTLDDFLGALGRLVVGRPHQHQVTELDLALARAVGEAGVKGVADEKVDQPATDGLGSNRQERGRRIDSGLIARIDRDLATRLEHDTRARRIRLRLGVHHIAGDGETHRYLGTALLQIPVEQTLARARFVFQLGFDEGVGLRIERDRPRGLHGGVRDGGARTRRLRGTDLGVGNGVGRELQNVLRLPSHRVEGERNAHG